MEARFFLLCDRGSWVCKMKIPGKTSQKFLLSILFVNWAIHSFIIASITAFPTLFPVKLCSEHQLYQLNKQQQKKEWMPPCIAGRFFIIWAKEIQACPWTSAQKFFTKAYSVETQSFERHKHAVFPSSPGKAIKLLFLLHSKPCLWYSLWHQWTEANFWT